MSDFRAVTDESGGLVDPTLTQRLMWRHILKWTAVTTSILAGAAAVTLIGKINEIVDMEILSTDVILDRIIIPHNIPPPPPISTGRRSGVVG